VPQSQLKLCFVLPSLHGGGAERAAVTVLNAIDSVAFDRELYLFRREGAYQADVARDVRIVIGAARSRPGTVAALARHIRATAPDVVMSFLSFFTIFAATKLAATRAKVVINQQTPVTAFLRDEDYRWRRPLRRTLFQAACRVVYPRATAIVATSEGVKRDLTDAFGVPEERVAVVHNPVDLNLIALRAAESVDGIGPRRPGRPLIVAAGRLAEAKNYPLLVEGLALLRDAHVDVDAWILGAGDQEPRIRAAIAAAHLEDRIHLLGFQENPWKFVGRADVFVLTSRYEGFGNVLIEAMACGVPVVATESPGTREIVRSEDNGLLVSDHHAPAIATALRRLLDDRALAFRLRARASETVRAYSVDVVARQYAALFSSVVGRSVAESHA